MENNPFYTHVSSWIESYFNPDALTWLRRFIDNSTQGQDVKEKLNKQIDRKIASLTYSPLFSEYDGMQLLMDKHNHPQIFTTRYAAMNKIVELRRQGYDVRLVEGGVFYRIQLFQLVPNNEEGKELVNNT